MAQHTPARRVLINATVPPGMTDVVDERWGELGFDTRTDYLTSLIEDFLGEREAHIALVRAPQYQVAETFNARVSSATAVRFRSRARGLSTRPTALLRSLIFRDLSVDVAGSVAVPDDRQGVLFEQMATG